MALKIGETATPERARQNGGVTEDVIDRALNNTVVLSRQRAKMTCLLDEYKLRGKITQDQYYAGMRFRIAYRGAYQVGKMSAFARVIASTGCYAFSSDYRVDCQDMIKEASSGLGALFPVVEAVCGWDQRPGTGRRFQMLRRGLDKLELVWGSYG